VTYRHPHIYAIAAAIIAALAIIALKLLYDLATWGIQYLGMLG
jgi:hypothetical protein